MTGRPSLLTPEMVRIAGEVAATGGAIPTIANACGVSVPTVKNWMRQGKEQQSPESIAFLSAIQDGTHIAEIEAIKKICTSRDPRDAQWWLTHHPTTRETWSDAAADRRAERKTMATVLEAMAAAGLPADLEQALILQMQARGLGAQPTPDA